MVASTSTTTFNRQNKQKEWQIIQVLLSLLKLSCIEWQKQRHCFTQNRTTRTESQIKLNNQVLLSVHNTKFTTLLLLLYIVFASLIYKSKKLKIMRIIKIKVHWCTIHIRCWVEIPCHAQFYHFHSGSQFGPSIHKTCWSPFELLITDYLKNPWSG